MEKTTIIICDDNDPLVSIMSQFFRKNGYEVLTASDGAEGLELLRSARPGLLLLDLEMPGVDGLGVLKGMAQLETRPYTLVISSQETAGRKEAALALGAKEYWTKPFSAAALLKHVQGLLAEGRLG